MLGSSSTTSRRIATEDTEDRSDRWPGHGPVIDGGRTIAPWLTSTPSSSRRPPAPRPPARRRTPHRRLRPRAPATGGPDGWRPRPSGANRSAVPASMSERMKDRFLGPALPNEALAHERLGKPTALAVFASDALSSTAYATEEILRTLIAAGIGVLAFSYVVPITLAHGRRCSSS